MVPLVSVIPHALPSVPCAYIYINVYRRPRSVGGGGVGGGGGRGNGIELKVTDGSRFPSTVVVTA